MTNGWAIVTLTLTAAVDMPPADGRGQLGTVVVRVGEDELYGLDAWLGRLAFAVCPFGHTQGLGPQHEEVGRRLVAAGNALVVRLLREGSPGEGPLKGDLAGVAQTWRGHCRAAGDDEGQCCELHDARRLGVTRSWVARCG